MTDLDVRVIRNITKEYPDMIKVMVYKEPRWFYNTCTPKRHAVEDFKPTVSSISRTKTLLRDIVLCNDFELFCTFTFDPAKVDSFNYNACRYVMSTWLHHQKDVATSKGRNFKYLIVPEKHKSGRWHFHALISGYSSTLKDTGLKTSTIRPIYNITSFRSGFTSATPIDSKEALSQYVTKYITKEFITIFNRKRFTCSNNLVRPVKTVNKDLRFISQIFHNKVAENRDSLFFLIDK